MPFVSLPPRKGSEKYCSVLWPAHPPSLQQASPLPSSPNISYPQPTVSFLHFVLQQSCLTCKEDKRKRNPYLTKTMLIFCLYLVWPPPSSSLSFFFTLTLPQSPIMTSHMLRNLSRYLLVCLPPHLPPASSFLFLGWCHTPYPHSLLFVLECLSLSPIFFVFYPVLYHISYPKRLLDHHREA